MLPDTPESISGTEIFGYYQTAEGRRFLREIYPIFEAAVPFGDRKIASIIADNNHSDQEPEIDRTRSALRRWVSGQSELWGKDAAKTLRLMKRLETEMMSLSAVAEVLADRASTIHRRSFMASLNLFFSGTINIGSKYRPSGPTPVDGLYWEDYAIHGVRDDNAALLSGSRFSYFVKNGSSNQLLIKEFSLQYSGTSSSPVFQNRYSGIGSLTSRGDFFRFMINLSSPSQRRIDALRRVKHRSELGWPLPPKSDDIFYTYQSNDLFVTPEGAETTPGYHADDYSTFYSPENHYKDRMIRRYMKLTKLDDPKYRFIINYVSGNEWDFLL